MRIATVGIVGAGAMGSGIAAALAVNGRTVLLHDRDPQIVAGAIGAGATFIQRQAEKGRISADEAALATGRLIPVADLAGLGEADLVIEAVFEDAALKATVLSAIAAVVRDATLIATNTSCLRVDDLASHVRRAERFLGLHFFSPAQVNPIVEVVRGARTDGAIAEAAFAFCTEVGKTPLRCRDQYGFAINRFFCPYTNEAARLLDEGVATTGEIDAVARRDLGVAAGPFAVMNLIKPRINLHAIRNLGPLGAFYAPAAAMVATGEADAPWPIDATDAPSPERAAAIAARLRAAMFLPVLQELDEAIAAPADIDHGAAQALRFGQPPCAAMDRLGRTAVEALISPLCERYAAPVPSAVARVGTLTSAG